MVKYFECTLFRLREQVGDVLVVCVVDMQRY
jgi:hypothetical protein